MADKQEKRVVRIPVNYEPRIYQLPFLQAMERGKKRACLVWHRRSGKTKTLFNFTIRGAFARVGTYYHCFPEYSQGRKILWDGRDKEGHPVMEWHCPQEMRVKTDVQEMKIELRSGSMWQIIGADNYDALVGPNPVGLVLDEYAVSEKYAKAWDYFRPILAENGGWAVFCFTPRGRNHAFELYQMALGNPSWFTQLLTVDDTGGVSKEAIEEERRAGMKEDMINQEFFCSFLASLDNVLIPFMYIQDALRRVVDYTRGPRFAGVDCARFGDDRSTMVIRQGFHVIHAEEWRKLDNVQLAGKVIDRYRTGFFDAVAIDVIGMPGVFDFVFNAGIPCVAVNVAESPAKNDERFNRLRDELWWSLRDYFMSATASIATSIPQMSRDALVKDIQDIRYSYKGITSKIVVEPKDNMKKRLGFSPDYGDALCNTFAPGLEMMIPVSVKLPFGYVQPVLGNLASGYNPLTFGLDQAGQGDYNPLTSGLGGLK